MKNINNTNSWVHGMLLLACAASASACEKQSAKPSSLANGEIGETQQALSTLNLDEPQAPPGARGEFFAPAGVAGLHMSFSIGGEFSGGADALFVADTKNHAVRRVEISTGLVTTLLGRTGIPGSADGFLRNPTAVAAISSPSHADLFMADSGNHAIRWVTRAPHVEGGRPELVMTIGTPGQSGYGLGSQMRFNNPQGVAIGTVHYWQPAGFHSQRHLVESIYVADTNNGVILHVELDWSRADYKLTPDGNDLEVVDGRYVASLLPSAVQVVAGVPGDHGFADHAVGTQAKFKRPTGLALVGTKLYVADTGNHVIRVIDLASGSNAVSTYAGVPQQYGYHDGAAAQALFAQPVSLTPHAGGLVVADRASYTIREIKPDAQGLVGVRTLAGSAWNHGSLDGDLLLGRLRAPSGVASLSDKLYIGDTGNHLIRALTPAAGGAMTLSTLTGQRKPGSSDGWPDQFTIGTPTDIECDGDRLIMNGHGMLIAQLDPSGSSAAVRTFASTPWLTFSYGGGKVFRTHAYSIEELDLVTGVSRFPVGSVDDDHSFEGMATGAGYLYVKQEIGAFITVPLGSGLPESWSWPDPNPLFGAELANASDGTFIYTRTPTGVRRANLTPELVSVEDIPLNLAGEFMIALAVRGDFAYFTSGAASPALRHTIRRAQLSTGEVQVFAGSVGEVDQPFDNPQGLCISGDYLYVADTGNSAIQKVDLATGQVTALTLRRAE